MAEIHVRNSRDEEQMHAQEDLHRGLKDRRVQMIAMRNDRRRFVSRFGHGDPEGRSGVGGVLRHWRIGHVLHHARPRRAAALPAGVRVLRHLCGRVRRALGGIHYWLLVHVGGHRHGGDNRRGRLRPLLASWDSSMGSGPDNPGVLYTANLITVKLFGEIEFWFALIKVVTIVAVIVIGLTIILFKFGDLGETASLSNLWTQGGFFPFGALGVLLTLQMVMFAYQGLELIGVSAGETENPEQVLPHAINSVVYWMLVLYIGALLIIMSLVAWNRLSPETSPFVLVFEKIGIPAGAGIINSVVINAAASSWPATASIEQ